MDSPGFLFRPFADFRLHARVKPWLAVIMEHGIIFLIKGNEMNLLRAAMTASLLFFAGQSLAIDCYHLDSKSDAYQTCMLRKENADREYRLKKEEKEKREAAEQGREATNVEARDNKYAFFDVLIEIELAEKKAGRLVGDCVAAFDEKGFAGAAMLCEQPAIILIATNQSPLVQEFSGEIENKKLETIFIGGLNVMKGSENYALRRYPKGVAIYIELKDSPEIFNEIAEKIRKKHSIEVFFKSEKQSAKFLLASP